MSTAIEWRGMQAFITALKNAPVEITNEADVVTKETAEGMKAAVQAQYNRVSDRFLRRAVKVKKLAKMAYKVSAGGSAHIYELGSAVRHTKAGHLRGQMPAKGPIFIPAAMSWRNQMVGRCEGIAKKSRGRSTTSGLL